MAREFEMSMIGELKFFLGFQIKQLKEGTFIHKEKYTKDILKKFEMDDCKPIKTPCQLMNILTWMREVNRLTKLSIVP